VTRLAEGDFAHLAPAFLPDGRHFLYRAVGARPGIYAASIEGGAATQIVEGGSRAQYVAGSCSRPIARADSLFFRRI
jgi:hypothetical protein